jgi:dTDP-glucose 4,6-dehydratase
VSRIVVTGGAGFVGSHLCDALLDRGDEVVAVDNLVTGSRRNVELLGSRPGFTFLEQDVARGLEVDGRVDQVMHLASPASPADFERIPIEIMEVGSAGTQHGLELAERHGATFFLASTSEVYGDPLVHPQPEDYLGNVSCTGPRAVYDEAKRYAEAMTSAFHRHRGVDVRIVRIFNTYGPRMRLDDGRVVSNLVTQALAGKPLTIYGDGAQTRSFAFVEDEVRGLLALLDSDVTEPVNIGSDGEFTVRELADIVLEVTGSSSEVIFVPRPVDDPQQRRPDLTRARTLLGWEPTIPLREGIARTAEDFRTRLAAAG